MLLIKDSFHFHSQAAPINTWEYLCPSLIMIKLQIWKGLTLVLTHTHIFYRYFRLEIWSPHIQYIHASTKPTHASSLLTIQIQWGGRGRSSKSSVVEPRNSQCEIFSWDFAISFSKDLFMKIVRFTFSSSIWLIFFAFYSFEWKYHK